MRYYTKILPFENTRRLAKVMDFRNQVVEYFKDCELDGLELIEGDRAIQLRPEMNKSLDEVYDIVQAAGVSTQFLYDPPPIRRGFRGSIDVLQNIFHLANLEIEPSAVCDQLDRAIGIYERNRRPAKLRMINPFFYLARLLDFVAEIPFAIWGAMGFDRKKAEKSRTGRVFKIVFQSVIFLAALFEALDYLGLWDRIRDALGRI